MSIDKQLLEKIAKEYASSDISLRDLAKKYGLGFFKLRNALVKYKTDWFNYKEIADKKRLKIVPQIPDKLMCLIARDFKQGKSVKHLAEKYGYDATTIVRNLKRYKTDWFNYRKIMKHMATGTTKNNQPQENISAKQLEKTLTALGFTKEESDVIQYAILNKSIKSKEGKIAINPVIAQQIIRKTDVKEIKRLLLPYLDGKKVSIETLKTA